MNEVDVDTSDDEKLIQARDTLANIEDYVSQVWEDNPDVNTQEVSQHVKALSSELEKDAIEIDYEKITSESAQLESAINALPSTVLEQSDFLTATTTLTEMVKQEAPVDKGEVHKLSNQVLQLLNNVPNDLPYVSELKMHMGQIATISGSNAGTLNKLCAYALAALALSAARRIRFGQINMKDLLRQFAAAVFGLIVASYLSSLLQKIALLQRSLGCLSNRRFNTASVNNSFGRLDTYASAIPDGTTGKSALQSEIAELKRLVGEQESRSDSINEINETIESVEQSVQTAAQGDSTLEVYDHYFTLSQTQEQISGLVMVGNDSQVRQSLGRLGPQIQSFQSLPEFSTNPFSNIYSDVSQLQREFSSLERTLLTICSGDDVLECVGRSIVDMQGLIQCLIQLPTEIANQDSVYDRARQVVSTIFSRAFSLSGFSP